MPHRFFIPSLLIANSIATISDPKVVRQITNVLRMKKNDLFTVFSEQTEYDLVIKDIAPHQITATALASRKLEREPARQVILYQSLLKKDWFEFILQKGTELGIKAFVPLICQNSIVRDISPNKMARYQAILKEATEQCGGGSIPTLEPAIPFGEALQIACSKGGQVLFAWEGETVQMLPSVLDRSARSYHLIIGPEGGFSADEIKEAERMNVHRVSLGRRILRAETAAIAAASLILLS
ncbi:MAG: RsmE family RNA methyltransferase [Patescibacteria group bacterium]|nr:RsmE family RNA methyltransferase [Patescibacteria group bacterium]MDD5715821.1 RsmE family RNA methyltransferase [Patescibacteria group bacterium]